MPPSSDKEGRATRIDWDAAYARLARIAEMLEHADGVSPEEAEALLRRRAEVLAAPEGATGSRETVGLLGFVSEGTRYGVYVEQVETVAESTVMAVPGLPSLHLGIFNMRGVVVSVIDLPRMLGRGGREQAEGPQAIVVLRTGQQRLGVAAEEVLGLETVATADIVPVSGEGAGDIHGAISGVTPGQWLVLDASYLVGVARIVVDEEVPIIAQAGDTGE